VIHKIQLGEDTDCPLAHGINMAGQLQRFRVDKINVGGRNGKDDTVWLGDVLGDESAGLLLDV
jgi:hypothetical protein